jgi:cytoskeletal protein CcmA (bactofilin family)
MLSSFKSSAPEKEKSENEVNLRAVQPHDRGTTKSGAASCIGSDMSIVGNVECKGTAQIFGRIEGELRASDLLIVCRQSISDSWLGNLREYLAHLV